VVRFISIFNQTAFRSEVLRSMVDTPFCRICHFCSISTIGGRRFRIRGLMGVNRWIVVRVTIMVLGVHSEFAFGTEIGDS
jgi:hypothetical protein